MSLRDTRGRLGRFCGCALAVLLIAGLWAHGASGQAVAPDTIYEEDVNGETSFPTSPETDAWSPNIGTLSESDYGDGPFNAADLSLGFGAEILLDGGSGPHTFGFKNKFITNDLGAPSPFDSTDDIIVKATVVTDFISSGEDGTTTASFGVGAGTGLGGKGVAAVIRVFDDEVPAAVICANEFQADLFGVITTFNEVCSPTSGAGSFSSAAATAAIVRAGLAIEMEFDRSAGTIKAIGTITNTFFIDAGSDNETRTITLSPATPLISSGEALPYFGFGAGLADFATGDIEDDASSFALTQFGLSPLPAIQLFGTLPPPDADADGIPDVDDLCPLTPTDQENIDTDGDGVGDGCDNCVDIENPLQENADDDELGDACDDLAGSVTPVTGSAQPCVGGVWIENTLSNDSALPLTVMQPDCFNTYYEFDDGGVWVGAQRSEMPDPYGFPDDVLTLATQGQPGDSASYLCDICRKFDPASLQGPGGAAVTRTFRATYFWPRQDPRIVDGVCTEEPEDVCAPVFVGAKELGTFDVIFEGEAVQAPDVKASCSLDPDTWFDLWTNQFPDAVVTATLDFSSDAAHDASDVDTGASIKMDGFVDGSSPSPSGQELTVEFNRQAAVSLYSGSPVGVPVYPTIQGFFGDGTAFTAECEAVFSDAIPVKLDIKPGTCPNSFNSNKKKGTLTVAILGTEEFDASRIDRSLPADDPSRLRISRDGVEGSVVPDPAKSRIRDVATPFEGEEECGCHTLKADGTDDLKLGFSGPEVAEGLELKELPNGSVELVVEGVLTDGTPFIGRDCVDLVAQKSSGTPLGALPTRDGRGFGDWLKGGSIVQGLLASTVPSGAWLVLLLAPLAWLWRQRRRHVRPGVAALALLAALALTAPEPAWGQASFCNEQDENWQLGDTDADGWLNGWECGITTGFEAGIPICEPSDAECDGSPAATTFVPACEVLFDPRPVNELTEAERAQCVSFQTPDVFAMQDLSLMGGTSGMPPTLFRFVSEPAPVGLGVAVHLIGDRFDRRVSPLSGNRAVRFQETPGGASKYGACSKGIPLDRCEVFPDQIAADVAAKCGTGACRDSSAVECDLGPETDEPDCVDTVADVMLLMKEHTGSHEFGHAMGLTLDENRRFGGPHDKGGSETVQEQFVVYTRSKKNKRVTYYVGQVFPDRDRRDVDLSQ